MCSDAEAYGGVRAPAIYGDWQALLEAPLRRFSSHVIDLGLVFVVLVWGFSPSTFKIILEELQPLTFIFLRFLLLSTFSLGVLAWRGRQGKRAWVIARGDVPFLIVSGLSGYGIYQLFYMVGLAHTTVFASALFASTVPLWSVVLLALLRAERIHPAQWSGILVSLLGVAWFLLAAPPHQSALPSDHAITSRDLLLGNVLSLAAPMLFALYGVTNKRLAQRYSPPELMAYTLVIGTIALAPFGIPALLNQHWSAVTWHTWIILPYSVIFPIYLTYSIWNWAIGQRGVGYVTLYAYAVPIVGGGIAWLLLGEALTLQQVEAGILVVSGMLAARWGATHALASARIARRRGRGVAQPPIDPGELSLDLAISAESDTTPSATAESHLT